MVQGEGPQGRPGSAGAGAPEAPPRAAQSAALPAGLDHSLDNRLVVGRRHGDNAGLSAFGRRDDAVDRVYHIRSSCTISFAV